MAARRPPHPDPSVEAQREARRARGRERYWEDPERWRKQGREWAKRMNEARKIEQVCPMCGTTFRSRRRGICCSRSCGVKRSYREGKRKESGRIGANHPSWKGGRHINAQGYSLIWVPPGTPGRHPNGVMLEHRYVMQQHLGRLLLSHEHVHHRNAVKTDNRLDNLELVTTVPHSGRVACPHCGGDILIR